MRPLQPLSLAKQRVVRALPWLRQRPPSGHPRRRDSAPTDGVAPRSTSRTTALVRSGRTAPWSANASPPRAHPPAQRNHERDQRESASLALTGASGTARTPSSTGLLASVLGTRRCPPIGLEGGPGRGTASAPEAASLPISTTSPSDSLRGEPSTRRRIPRCRSSLRRPARSSRSRVGRRAPRAAGTPWVGQRDRRVIGCGRPSRPNGQGVASAHVRSLHHPQLPRRRRHDDRPGPAQGDDRTVHQRGRTQQRRRRDSPAGHEDASAPRATARSRHESPDRSRRRPHARATPIRHRADRHPDTHVLLTDDPIVFRRERPWVVHRPVLPVLAWSVTLVTCPYDDLHRPGRR